MGSTSSVCFSTRPWSWRWVSCSISWSASSSWASCSTTFSANSRRSTQSGCRGCGSEMVVFLVIVPLLAAVAAFLAPSDRQRPWIVAVTAGVHTALAFASRSVPAAEIAPWLQLDALGRLVVIVVSTLFLVCAIYCIGYLRVRAERPNRIFCTTLLGFLSMTSLVVLAQNLTVMWVAMEATTLATALLLYFNQNRRSLEATWKYLMIGSVGIALALLGTLFLAYAALLGFGKPTLDFAALVARAPSLSAPWLRTAFLFLLLGYGTKMGIAPLHTWKPDAYGEAPRAVGADRKSTRLNSSPTCI